MWLMGMLVTAAASLFIGATVAPRAHAAANAQVTAYPIPTSSSTPQLMVLGPDDNLWFSEYSANQIGRITSGGVITEFPLPTSNSGPFGIAVGSDNNLWFTEYNASQIGRITTSGTVTEFPLPSSGSGPNGIAAGPDGSLWFTEFSADKIGSITPSGTITEYALPTSGSGANLITAGPDGNLWFTEFYTDKIGRMTTAGSLTEFTAGASLGGGPTGIAAGPDGNIWFTEYYASAIGRITTAGTGVTEFPTPTAASQPYGIATGANGALWFAEISGGRVAQITTTGATTEFATPAGSQPYAVLPGADGNMWATDGSSNNAIDRLVIQSPCLNLQVSGTPNPVVPGGTETVGISLANCGSAGLSGLTTSMTVTPPSGCGAAPPIADVTGDLAAGSSTTGGGSFTAPTCYGTYDMSTQTTQGSTVLATTTASYTVQPCLNLQVTPSPNPVLPGGNEAVGVAVTNCGALALTGLTTSTTVTPPSGCSAAPPISDVTGDLAAGATTTGGSSFTAPTCLGTYAMSTQTTQGSTILATTTASYTVSPAVEFPTSGRPVGITSGSDANVWFTSDDATVNRIDPTGNITRYPIPSNLFNLFRITWGPDGALWMTSNPTGVVQMTTNGRFTEFAMPGDDIRGITTGPDGNLWITDGANNRIGRMTTLGSVTWFALPPGTSPDQIVSGSDGALWFAGGTAIGRLTTSGAVSLFQLPAGAGVADVALGPDGNVWYTDGSRNLVGRISTSGAVTEYPTPTQPSVPIPLSAAADGGVWFAETSLHAADESLMGRVSPNGAITELPLFTQPANPKYGVTAGPDGNLWVSEYYGLNVARVSLTASPCTPLTATAAPASVRHASPEVLRATIGNCSNTPQVLSLTTNITSTARCSTPSTVGTNVPLQPLVKTVVSDAFKAPKCKGTYTATMTLSSGGSALATSTVTYKVT